MIDRYISVLGILISFTVWLFHPHENVSIVFPIITFVVLYFVGLYCYSKVKSLKVANDKITELNNIVEKLNNKNVALKSRIIDIKGLLLIFKVNVDNVFTVNSVVTVFIRNGNFNETVAVGYVENMQDHNLVQVRIIKFLENKSAKDLEIRERLFLRPGLDRIYYEGEL